MRQLSLWNHEFVKEKDLKTIVFKEELALLCYHFLFHLNDFCVLGKIQAFIIVKLGEKTTALDYLIDVRSYTGSGEHREVLTV